MKAALYEGKHSIKLTTQPIPERGPNDVLIKNLRAGICGSDVAVYEHGLASGHKIKLDHPFGHEMISVVAAVGKNVTDFKVGQRVYPYPLLASGDPSNAGSLGGFSEYLLVPDARLNRELYLIPDSISNRTGALIEPFTVGTHAAYQAHPQPGENRDRIWRGHDWHRSGNCSASCRLSKDHAGRSKRLSFVNCSPNGVCDLQLQQN